MIDPENLARMGARAFDILEDRAESGNIQAARALADHAVAENRGKLSVPIPLTDGQLSTVDGVIDAAQTASLMALGGSLSLNEAKAVMGILRDYAQMRAMERIEELQLLITQMENRQAQGVTLSEDLLPRWGNLRQHIESNDKGTEH